ncbi:Z-ring formation inhibitor MciZ [Niallia sp. 03133]|uniref:Z-ring formation inhibitor MciZ n=1 Tax=Niallia sp. 03133 TaxID=3458060 RepID=UPI004044739A
MKIYLHERGIICTGKAWQVRRLLKQYTANYTYVKEWIEDGKSQQIKVQSLKNHPFEKKT